MRLRHWSRFAVSYKPRILIGLDLQTIKIQRRVEAKGIVSNFLDELKQTLQKRFSGDTYKIWFQPLQCAEYTADRLVLVTDTTFASDWLDKNYRDVIEQSVMQLAGHPVTVVFKSGEVEEDKAHNEHTNQHVATQKQDPKHCGLLAHHTFENFIVGAANQLAYAAAVASASSPGRAYNPLFIHGNTGLGKTHLMQSIGNHILQHQVNARISYVTTERFTNDFIDAIQKNKLPLFRRKYRSMDVLLIDDIHFLSGKERIQEEFFHTFNELFDSKRQIVLCSDRPASEISNLEGRLVSRFQWGLVCDVKAPDFETRVAILLHKAKQMGLTLSRNIVEHLAQRVVSNVRRMEGALNRIASYQQLLHQASLSLDKVDEMLEDIFQEELAARVTIEDIQKAICDFYHLSLPDLLNKRRLAKIAFPRQIAMYLCRLLTSDSLAEIGNAFGGRDHGTVIHACKAVEGAIQRERMTKQTVQFLQQKLMSKS